MDEQISIKPYERRMPDMPKGVVPTSGRVQTLVLAASKSVRNPVSGNATSLDDGRIFYGYYCVMCHGADGHSNGPVGQGYVPKPTDLTSPTVTGLTDGELYDRMLHGIGHDPVMVQTVLPQQRWTIILYVRTLPGAPHM